MSRIFPSILTIPRGFSLSYLRNPYFLQRQLFLQWFAPILDMDFLACLFVLIIQNEISSSECSFWFCSPVVWIFPNFKFCIGIDVNLVDFPEKNGLMSLFPPEFSPGHFQWLSIKFPIRNSSRLDPRSCFPRWAAAVPGGHIWQCAAPPRGWAGHRPRRVHHPAGVSCPPSLPPFHSPFPPRKGEWRLAPPQGSCRLWEVAPALAVAAARDRF